MSERCNEESGCPVEMSLAVLGGIEPNAEHAASSVQRARGAVAAAGQASRRRMLLRAVSGIGATVAIAGSLWMAGFFGFGASSALAWDDVVEAVNATRSVRYRSENRHTYRSTDADGNESNRIVDLNFTIHATSTGIVRYEDDFLVIVTDAKTGEELTLIPSTKEAYRTERKPNKTTNIYTELLQVDELMLERIENREIDGRPATGFVVNRAGAPWKKGTKIWIDSETRLPVRFEYGDPDEPTDHTFSGVMSDFHFEADANPDLFQLEPPDGFKLVEPKAK